MVNKKLLIACLALGVVACVGLLFMTMLNSPYGLTSVEHTNVKYKSLASAQSDTPVKGTFTSPENYLGIIYLPLKTSGQLQEIPVRFVLADKKTGKKLHTHDYVAKNFSDKPFFPIGLPLIQNSKNVEYEFAIVKMDKNEKLTGLSLDNSKDINTVHLFDRRDMRRSNIWGFAKGKLMASVEAVGLWPFLLILAGSISFPFVVQAFVNVGILKAIEKRITIFLWLIQILTVSMLILIPKQVSDLFYTVWIFFHLGISYVLKSKPKLHYYWALFTLLTCPVFLAFSDDLRAEKAAIFVFFFLTFGVFQEIYLEVRKNIHKKTNHEDTQTY